MRTNRQHPAKYAQELPIIQRTYDLIVWYVPLLNKLPRDHKFNLGDRITTGLYTLLEELLAARYSREKLPLLQALNLKLEILRYQTRLLLDLGLFEANRYEYAVKQINSVGGELGNWIKQQRKKARP